MSTRTRKSALAIAVEHVLALSDADKAALTAMLISMGTAPAQAQVSAPAPASAPARKERTLPPVKDEQLPVTPVKAGRGKVAFALGNGSGRAGAKLMIKSAGIVEGMDKDEQARHGFVWDTYLTGDKHEHGAWVASKADADAIGYKQGDKFLHVPAKWVQAGRDKAAAKAEKKAARA